jgi:hypothetical protein
MPRRFRDLTEEERASHTVAEEARDESFVYCPSCGRAMEQGDCIVDEDLEQKLRCAYGDCILNANIAMHSLTAWDAYRALYEEETADWPDVPTPGECYRSSGDTA